MAGSERPGRDTSGIPLIRLPDDPITQLLDLMGWDDLESRFERLARPRSQAPIECGQDSLAPPREGQQVGVGQLRSLATCAAVTVRER